MRTVVATLESIAPYSQARRYTEPAKKAKESPADYEARTWRSRCHVTENGKVFIPPMAFKNCVADAASFLSLRIPGRGTATYTKHFEAGVLVMDALILPIKADEVKGEWLFVPSDGKKGGGKRVDKCFPVIHEWKGDVTFYVLDETITQEVFEQHLREAGNFIGIGRFRPRRGGFYGRFKVVKLQWS